MVTARRIGVYLPRVEGETDQLVMESSLNDALRGDETIFLVEDDQMVRALAEAILERYGYTVIATRNVQDALHFAREKTFDLPLNDGRTAISEPASHIAAYHQNVTDVRPYEYRYRFDRPIAQKMEDAFLQKPFTPETISAQGAGSADCPKQ